MRYVRTVETVCERASRDIATDDRRRAAAATTEVGSSDSGGAPEGALDVRCDITDPDAVEAAFAQVEEAQQAVIATIRSMEERGEVVVRRGGDDEFVD